MTDLRITQQARRMVDFEELVAAIRLAAKSAIRNPEWVPMRERNSPQTKEAMEAAYKAWAHRHFRELQSSPQLRTIHWAQHRKAQAWLKGQGGGDPRGAGAHRSRDPRPGATRALPQRPGPGEADRPADVGVHGQGGARGR